MSREDVDNGETSTVSFTSSSDKFRILLNGMYCRHGELWVCINKNLSTELKQAYNMMETVSSQ